MNIEKFFENLNTLYSFEFIESPKFSYILAIQERIIKKYGEKTTINEQLKELDSSDTEIMDELEDKFKEHVGLVTEIQQNLADLQLNTLQIYFDMDTPHVYVEILQVYNNLLRKLLELTKNPDIISKLHLDLHLDKIIEKYKGIETEKQAVSRVEQKIIGPLQKKDLKKAAVDNAKKLASKKIEEAEEKLAAEQAAKKLAEEKLAAEQAAKKLAEEKLAAEIEKIKYIIPKYGALTNGEPPYTKNYKRWADGKSEQLLKENEKLYYMENKSIAKDRHYFPKYVIIDSKSIKDNQTFLKLVEKYYNNTNLQININGTHDVYEFKLDELNRQYKNQNDTEEDKYVSILSKSKTKYLKYAHLSKGKTEPSLDTYESKYLKYKNKYLKLKQKLSL